MLSRFFLPLIMRKFSLFCMLFRIKISINVIWPSGCEGNFNMRARKLISFLKGYYWVEKSHAKENLCGWTSLQWIQESFAVIKFFSFGRGKLWDTPDRAAILILFNSSRGQPVF